MSRATLTRVLRSGPVVRHLFACDAHAAAIGDGARPLEDIERREARCAWCANPWRPPEADTSTSCEPDGAARRSPGPCHPDGRRFTGPRCEPHLGCRYGATGCGCCAVHCLCGDE